MTALFKRPKLIPEDELQFLQAVPPAHFARQPRVLIIGGGSRGNAYAHAASHSTNAIIAAIAEPIAYKRNVFGRRYVWKDAKPRPYQAFSDWRDWVKYEEERREKEKKGEKVERGIDAVFVCVLDEMHEEVVCGIAGLRVHVCVEKPLSTSLQSCMNIYRALKPGDIPGANGHVNGDANGLANDSKPKEVVFGICHVLRYSQHNMMLRHLVLEKNVIGDIMSVEHVEPVGWWHFSHSYVRGNWRKESRTAPSLLTKSCHDIDFLLWLLCTPAKGRGDVPHLPSHVTSTGSKKFYRKERKPKQAGAATNCLSCPHEQRCDYSAKKIYTEKRHMTGWPVKVVNPEIEEIYRVAGRDAAVKRLLKTLKEDYTAETPQAEVEARPWYGRCVYEADNDVCDDQCVTITWDDDPLEHDAEGQPILKGRGAKTAQFHMIAFTEKICQRRGRIYGSKGEIEYDSTTIRVHDFSTGKTKVYTPHYAGGGHGGGDRGLARQFLLAADAVDNQGMSVSEAQRKFLGCDLDEAFLSHAMVFAAEDARTKRQVVDWKKWWSEEVEQQLEQR